MRFSVAKRRMKDLGTLGGDNSQASCINDNEEVVGTTDTKDGVSCSFIWENNKMFELSRFATGSVASPSFINEKEQIIGTYRSGVDGTRYSLFIWENGKVTDLGVLGFDTEGVKVNKTGGIIANGHAHVGGFGEAYYLTKDTN